MNDDDGIFALGKLGERVRLITVTTLDHARELCGEDEVIARLHTIPREPVMILADGSDVIGISDDLAK